MKCEYTSILGREAYLGFYVGGVNAQCSRNIGDEAINVAPSIKHFVGASPINK
jgi:hypothetical protein